MPTFEPMSVGGIVDNAFRLYKRNFTRFIAIVAVVQVPMSLLMILAQSLMAAGQQTPAQGSGAQAAMFIGGGATMILAVLFAIVAGNLSKAALVRSVSQSYLGGDVTVGEAYRYVLPKLLTIILASFLVALVAGVGFVFCIVPGVIFMLWFALAIQVIVIEGQGVTASMARSKELVKGNMGKVFLVGLILFLIGLLAGGIATGISTVLRVAFGLPLFGPEAQSPVSLAIGHLFDLVANLLAAPIGAAAMILLYYDLRIRKEGFDLEMLARQFGGQGAGSDVGHEEP